jgi:hypothetical protein
MAFMSDMQTWAIIGVFTTIILGGMTAMTTLLTRATNGTLAGMEGRLSGRIEALDQRLSGRIEALEAHMDGRFEAMGARIGHLDRDVNLLMRRAWNERDDE